MWVFTAIILLTSYIQSTKLSNSGAPPPRVLLCGTKSEKWMKTVSERVITSCGKLFYSLLPPSGSLCWLLLLQKWIWSDQRWWILLLFFAGQNLFLLSWWAADEDAEDAHPSSHHVQVAEPQRGKTGSIQVLKTRNLLCWWCTSLFDLEVRYGKQLI